MTEHPRPCPWVNAEELWPMVGEWFLALGRDSRGFPSVSILVRLGDAFYRCPHGGINRDLVRETDPIQWWTYGPAKLDQIPHAEALRDERRRLQNRLGEIDRDLGTFAVDLDSPPVPRPPPEDPFR